MFREASWGQRSITFTCKDNFSVIFTKRMFQIKVTISISIRRLKFSLLQLANNKFISTFLYYFGFSQLMKTNSRYVYFSWLLQFLMISKFDREQNLGLNICVLKFCEKVSVSETFWFLLLREQFITLYWVPAAPYKRNIDFNFEGHCQMSLYFPGNILIMGNIISYVCISPA